MSPVRKLKRRSARRHVDVAGPGVKLKSGCGGSPKGLGEDFQHALGLESVSDFCAWRMWK